ncbi:MAG: hypothetical protein J6Q29_02995 [Alistipes sp.]|nr:hypothetical protein [Alistipes sp.]
MKRLILAITMAFTLTSCGIGYYSYSTPTPIKGSINISLQPSWGPAGYDFAMYYYFPEFNFYYDVERAVFHYLNYGRWVSAKVLPRGHHFPTDLHRYYKVVINHHNPWNYNRQHKQQYKHYKGVYTQRNLRDIRFEKETPRRIQPPHYSTPSRNNNTLHTPQSTPHRGQGGVGQGSSGSRPQQGNVGRPSGTPSRNNATVRPGSGSTSQGNVRPGGSTSGNVRPSGSTSGNVRPGSSSSKGNVKPSGSSTPSRGAVKQGGTSSSKGTSSSNRSSGSKSSGARSSGSRGR